MKPSILLGTVLAWAALFPFASRAQDAARGLTDMSLEELMNVEVTLAARKAEKISETSAAVFLLTADDIRRSGVTTLPEALRLVPGFDVARVDANKWAVSCRGFNNLFANKLLVLIDGRSVYSPMFSGVFWESADLMLEDVERIEVIRGPGAALWGANAMNGVVNVITRRAADTRGVLIHAGGGTEEKAFASARAGFSLGPAVRGRVFVKAADRDGSETAAGVPGHDEWNTWRAGFRVEANPGARTAWTLMGDGYGGRVGQVLSFPAFSIRMPYRAGLSGGYLLGRFERAFSPHSNLRLQMSVDRFERNREILIGGRYTCFDVDLQHCFRPAPRHEVLWGAGYRVTRDRIAPTQLVWFEPDRRTFSQWSAFIQDEIALKRDRFRLTVGSRFERNDFTGIEVQPNVRLLIKPGPASAAWASVSRAVRTPARADHDLRTLNMIGSHRFGSESVVAYELGYHLQPRRTVILDLTAFINDYSSLQSFENDTVANLKSAASVGFECTAGWDPFHGCRLRAAYSFIRLGIQTHPSSLDLTAREAELEIPEHQGSMRASFDLPGRVTFDATLRAVGELSSASVKAASYAALDARLAWKAGRGVEFAVVGQNLNRAGRTEFMGWWIPFESTVAERGVYASVRFTR